MILLQRRLYKYLYYDYPKNPGSFDQRQGNEEITFDVRLRRWEGKWDFIP